MKSYLHDLEIKVLHMSYLPNVATNDIDVIHDYLIQTNIQKWKQSKAALIGNPSC